MAWNEWQISFGRTLALYLSLYKLGWSLKTGDEDTSVDGIEGLCSDRILILISHDVEV